MEQLVEITVILAIMEIRIQEYVKNVIAIVDLAMDLILINAIHVIQDIGVIHQLEIPVEITVIWEDT